MVRILLSAAALAFLAGIGFAANDYIRQAVMRGQSPAEFGLAGWADSFAERGRAAARRAELEMAREKPLRDYLPTAPAGWTRSAWAPEHSAALRPPERSEFEGEDRIVEEIGALPVVRVVETVSALPDAILDRKPVADRWTYLKDSRVVVMQARFVSKARTTGMAARLATSMETGEGRIFKLHRGIALHLTPELNFNRFYNQQFRIIAILDMAFRPEL